MLIDSHTLPAGTALDAQVCIIGGGAAGITLAREFIGQPFRVILLESGGLAADTKTQKLYEGRTVGRPYYPLTICRLRYFGGTTNHWAGECRPLREIDFESRAGMPHSGWPFTRESLESFYQRAASICQLSPAPYDVATWATEQTPPIPIVKSQLRTSIMQFSPPTRFGEVYGDELKAADNIRVCLYANALNIETDSQGRTATRITATTLEGNTFSVSAKFFILATGAIENARLLLLSNEVQQAGLGNAHDLVGRFFMEHLEIKTALWLRSDSQFPLGLYQQHAVEKPSHKGQVFGTLTFDPEVLRKKQLPNFRCELHDISAQESVPLSTGEQSLRHIVRAARRGHVPDAFMLHLKSVLGDFSGVANAALRRVPGDPQHFLTLVVIAEQTPNPESRVTLTDLRDSLGKRRVQLAWRLADIDYANAGRIQKLIAQELGRLGLGRVKSLLNADTGLWRLNGQHHHMGTTRMHTDPKQGVVDANCKVHGMANLFVAGSSVFPTGGGGTPTLTLVALALRMADHIKALLQ